MTKQTGKIQRYKKKYLTGTLGEWSDEPQDHRTNQPNQKICSIASGWDEFQITKNDIETRILV